MSPVTGPEAFARVLAEQLRGLVDSTRRSKATLGDKLTTAEQESVTAAVDAAQMALRGDDAKRIAQCLQYMVRADEILRKATLRP